MYMYYFISFFYFTSYFHLYTVGDQGCASEFILADEIRTEAKKITVVDDEYSSAERLYKDIKFTCE